MSKSTNKIKPRQVVLYNHTLIPDDILSEVAAEAVHCAYKLPDRYKINLIVTWGRFRSVSGLCGYRAGCEADIKLRLPRDLVSCVDSAMDVFFVLIHELFHASEYFSGRIKSNATGDWNLRPREIRATYWVEGIQMLFLRNNRLVNPAKKAVIKLAEAFADRRAPKREAALAKEGAQ